MHYEMMTVTPELANRWLEEKNKRNRPISKITVDAYADDMRKSRWKNSHQNAIAFYKDGCLADGQHRLAAIVQSSRSIDLMVWFGLEQEDAYGIDAHKARNTHDQIKIAMGDSWINKDIIATARMMMGQNFNKKPSPQQIAQYCDWHKEALLFSLENIPKSSFSAAVRVAVAIAFYHEDGNDLAEWCRVARTGIGITEKDRGAILLRERLVKDETLKSQGGANREKICKLTMKSIKSYCKGSIVTRLVEPKERVYEILS